MVVRSQYSGELVPIEAVEVFLICEDIVQVPMELLCFIYRSYQSAYCGLLQPGMGAVPGTSLLLGANYPWKVMTGEVGRQLISCPQLDL